MSVKRYRHDFDGSWEDDNGHFVDYDDYARLKAEVERLTALVESNLNSSKVAMGKADAMLHERDSLKAEVERLRKMLYDLVEAYEEGQLDALLFVIRQSAKEGKPSV